MEPMALDSSRGLPLHDPILFYFDEQGYVVDLPIRLIAGEVVSIGVGLE